MGFPKKMIGKKFGNWTVVSRSYNRGQTLYYLCRCKCGVEKDVSGNSLRMGNSRGCRCDFGRHRQWKSRVYSIWSGLKNRCFSESNPRYSHYGGRGITVCDDWKNDFVSFWEWAMANGYESSLTIDRINNDGDYCPENCRWVTRAENNRNRPNIRPNRMFVEDQVIEIRKLGASGLCTQKQIGVMFGVNQQTISKIINRRSYKEVD